MEKLDGSAHSSAYNDTDHVIIEGAETDLMIGVIDPLNHIKDKETRDILALGMKEIAAQVYVLTQNHVPMSQILVFIDRAVSISQGNNPLSTST
jgi:hypothetical protein